MVMSSCGQDSRGRRCSSVVGVAAQRQGRKKIVLWYKTYYLRL